MLKAGTKENLILLIMFKIYQVILKQALFYVNDVIFTIYLCFKRVPESVKTFRLTFHAFSVMLNLLGIMY